MTKGEIQAVLFVAVSMLAGGLVLLVNQFDSDFMPDLVPAAADGRMNAGIQGQSAQTAPSAMATAGWSPGAGSGVVDGKSSGDVPHAPAVSPGADDEYPVPGHIFQ